MHKLAPCLLITCSLFSGCQAAGGPIDTHSAPGAAVGPVAANAIAGDMASQFAEHIDRPVRTPIKMDADGSDYASALEAALRGWGFVVITDGRVGKNQKPIQLTYSIDSLNGEVLARLMTPSIALGRAYATTTAGATPASPLSIMQRQ